MQARVNIVIPAIKANDELLKCLRGINKINYSNFFVTIVLDKNSNIKFPKYKYKIKKLIVNKINMSKKRNIAVKKFQSKYIAFIDSDAYPNKNWLKLGIKYLKSKKADVVGGPGLPFPNENYVQKICYFSKRSYFVTGYLSFRKYKAKKRFCDWLESCNLIMKKRFFLKYGGMDEKRYTGEDKEFFIRVRKKKQDLKVFYSPDLYIHHKERRMFGFFLQRFVFGMDFINLMNTSSGLLGLQPLIPVLLILSTIIFLFSNIIWPLKFIIFSVLVGVVCIAILFDILRYAKSFKSIFFTICTIVLANVSFALGSIVTLIGLRKILDVKTYSFSRNKEKTISKLFLKT